MFSRLLFSCLCVVVTPKTSNNFLAPYGRLKNCHNKSSLALECKYKTKAAFN